jgi:sulfur carrier protein
MGLEMKIRVNGRDIEFIKTTVSDLLKLYRFDPEKIMVERNGSIVEKEQYTTLELQEGDVLEIARFVGGG